MLPMTGLGRRPARCQCALSVMLGLLHMTWVPWQRPQAAPSAEAPCTDELLGHRWRRCLLQVALHPLVLR